jgi:hypothetical protein
VKKELVPVKKDYQDVMTHVPIFKKTTKIVDPVETLAQMNKSVT